MLGYEKFYELFPIILTDNGTEFSRPDIIENTFIQQNYFIAIQDILNKKEKLKIIMNI